MLMYWLALVMWVLPLGLAIRLACREVKGRRRTWWVMALCCAVIVLDKAVDLQQPVYELCQQLVAAWDPDERLWGAHLIWRYLLLGGLFLAGALGLWWLVRGDQGLHLGKSLALFGMLLIMLYMGLRLVPAVGERITASLDKVVQVGCWFLVLLGQGLSLRCHRPSSDRLA